MPLITAEQNPPLPEPSPAAPPAEVNWGKVEDDVRTIEVAEDKSSAIYVIEEAPGKKQYIYSRTPYSVYTPWIYFLIKVDKDCIVSSFAGMYVLFSHTRQETLDEETLLVPYFSNLFRHGGVCMNHTTVFKTRRPMTSARLAVGWFWDSSGGSFWSHQPVPPELQGSYGDSTIQKWSGMSEEDAKKISWEVPRFKSIKAAVKGLSFKYYTENYWKARDTKDCVNDMTGEVGNPF
jgi:hypothetical protein